MKKIIYLHFILLFCLISCAKERLYIQIPESSRTKTIALSEVAKGKKSKPYIVNGERYYPLPDSHGFVQTGKASWYGGDFHGKTTANGEIYNMYKYTAAHKILPLGTHVKVVNLSNQKHTVVRINDRGPFVKGRIIDLSYAAARDLQIIGPGIADVEIIALGKEIAGNDPDEQGKPMVEIEDVENGVFTIQIGAFENRENAERLAERLKVIFEYVKIIEQNDERKMFYKVHVSKSQTLSRAGEMERKLEDMGFEEAFIVRI
ncbi:MAG: septal ring lytic transglycosylase RlpA family protein [Deltaproteobacteria bacterium]|nr:septal ring lytic transglycosylase RlpA family protein [Deltaproteobacteria bacterium]